MRPIFDVDIFWQLKLGEIALDRGGPVTTEPFAASHLGEPLAQLAWLGQIVLAAVRRVGGWSGLQVFDALVWLGGFCAAAFAARRSSSEPAGVVAALMLAFGFAFSFASLRPQSFAVLGFGMLMALLTLRQTWPIRLLSIAGLLVLWQNLHPSVAVAALYLSARAGWSWLSRLSGRRDRLPWADTALVLLAGLALFATPMGTEFIAVSAQNASASAAMSVDEWQAAWSESNVWLLPFSLPIPLTFLVLLYLRRESLDWTWLFPCLVLFVASLFVVRFGLFWAISTIPVVAPLLTPKPDQDRVANLDVGLATMGLALSAGLALAFHQPRFSDWLPLQGIASLKKAGVHGTVFAELPWGGPLIDGGYPTWRVALDGRYYVFTDTELALARTVGKSAKGLAQIEGAWAPAAILVDPDLSAKLVSQLRQSPSVWQELTTGDHSVAFVRVQQLPANRRSAP